MKHLTRNKLRQFIYAGQCPWCNDNRDYIVLARHTYSAHGISAYELREMAGLNRGSSICDPDHSAKMAEIARKRPPELQRRILKAGRTLEVIQRRDHKKRSEGRANHLKWLLSSEKIEQSVKVMHSPEAHAKMKLSAQNRPPEIVQAQTERVIKGNEEWYRTHTSQEKRERAQRTYQTTIKRHGLAKVLKNLDDARAKVPPEAHVKAGHAAAKIIPLYHADPEWKAKWWANFTAGIKKRDGKKGQKHKAERST